MRGRSMRTSLSWRHLLMFSVPHELRCLNLQPSVRSRSFLCSKHGPDSPFEGQSLGQLGPHGSWGFSPVGGKPLVLWGGTGERPLEKRERGLPELLTVLAVNLKENYLLDPCVVSSNRSGELSFFLGQNLREGQWSPERKPPLRGDTRKSGALHAGKVPSPSTGLGSLGLTAPDD